VGWRTEVWRGYYADASSSVIERRTTAHDSSASSIQALGFPWSECISKRRAWLWRVECFFDPSLAVGRMTYASICDRPSANATLNHPNGRN
jgi:hypothetical protein